MLGTLNVEYPQDEDVASGHLVANLVISHQNLAYLARLEFCKPDSQTRVRWNSFGTCNQLTNHAHRDGDIDGLQELVKANEVRAGTAGPFEGHG